MDVDYLDRKLYYRHFRWDSGQNQPIDSVRRSDLDGSNEELIHDHLGIWQTTVRDRVTTPENGGTGSESGYPV